ncbi:MAG: response regulator [Nitrospirae bacterium]|nr:response regulator [Nitrospirota bacterium]
MGYLFWSSIFGYIGGSSNFLLVFDLKVPILNEYGTYAVPIYVGATTYAIVRYQLMDIRTVVHKTAMWLGMSSLVLIPVGIGFYFGHGVIQTLSPLQHGLLVGVLAILLIPYVKGIQPRIDNIFHRRKYDMQAIIQGLVRELAALKNLDLLIAKIATKIKEALYVSRITIIVLDDKNQNFKVIGAEEKLQLDDPCLSCIRKLDGVIEWEEIELNPKFEPIRQVAKSYFQKFDAKIVLPLIHDGKLIGAINLGEKDNLKSFSKVDIDFLSNLKTEASIALSNSLLYDNVNKMSKELKQWSIELEQKVDERTSELAERKKELEESYEKLKELDQFKTEFFANVNHELRTPLTLILLPVEMALNKDYGELSPALEKNLMMVKTNGFRLLNLINGLLDLAKTDAGKMELFKNKYDLSLITQGIVSSLALMADKKNIKLTFLAKSPLPEFYFDREKIERVLINSISNALKFTDADGVVEVSLARKEEKIEIRVKDTGIGIPESFREKVFERFTQVDSSSVRKYQGTGLGLALCKEFVELHEGKIWVESEEGKGSTFVCLLPVVANIEEGGYSIDRRVKDFENAEKRRNVDLTKSLSINALYQSPDLSKPDEIQETPVENGNKKYQILIVEDNLEMQAYIRSILKDDHLILTAKNGVEGIEKIKLFKPDMIISDLMMPLKDGYQLCREVKTDKETRHIPVILLTAKSDVSCKIEGLEAGANEYLSKPFNAEELKARVRSLLQLKALEKENAQTKKMAAMAVMVAGVIHEINNPISFTKTSWQTISEALDRLKTIAADSNLEAHREEVSELMGSADLALEIVKKGLDRIQHVVGRLRIFEGNRSLDFEPVNINNLITRLAGQLLVLDRTGGLSTDKETIFKKDFHVETLIEAIPVLLTQSLEVIMDNALKATEGAGPVSIKTWEEPGEKVFISIKDRGKGIKKEKLEHLFEPFFTMRDVGEGMGLGLFLAYQVVQAHHGFISVKSQENVGTEMIIQLPVSQPKPDFLPNEQSVQSSL